MPKPPTVRALLAPVALGAIGVGAAAALAALGAQRAVPLGCPFLALTGWSCPLCGGTRAGAALAEGEVATAVDFNAFTTVGVLVLTGVWLAWVVATARGRTLAIVVPPWLWAAVAMIGVCFAVVRNLPGPLSALAP